MIRVINVTFCCTADKSESGKKLSGKSQGKVKLGNKRARKSRTTLQNKVRLKVLPEQLTLFVNTSVTFKKCII